MKRNMFNKITNWTEKLKDWISDKKPNNKYLRIAYYFLIGLICFMFAIPLVIFLLVVIVSVLWLFKYLINFNFVRIIMTLLASLLLLLIVSLFGYLVIESD